MYNIEGSTQVLLKSVGIFHLGLDMDKSVMSFDMLKERNCSRARPEEGRGSLLL